MKKLLTLLFVLISVFSIAQYSPSGAKVNYVNGIAIGQFLGGAVPGDSTGHNQTGSKFDVSLTAPDVRIALRFRQNGFNNLMPNQDVASSIGGIQNIYNNPSYGGLLHYGFSTANQAFIALGYAGTQRGANDTLADAVLTLRGGVRNLSIVDQAGAIFDTSNLLSLKNGTNNKWIVKGNGTLQIERGYLKPFSAIYGNRAYYGGSTTIDSLHTYGYNADYGNYAFGSGNLFDHSIFNKNGTLVLSNPTGTTNINITGTVSAGTFSGVVNVGDTATMLSNRLKISDTTTMLSARPLNNRFLDSISTLRTLANSKASTQYWQRPSSYVSPATAGDGIRVPDATNSFVTYIPGNGNISTGINGGNQTSMGSDYFTFYQSSPNKYMNVGTRNLSADRIVNFQNKTYTVADSADVPVNVSGSWTPTLTCGTSGTITLNGSYARGEYTLLGDRVFCTVYIVVSSVSSPVGSLTLGGLPYTVAASPSGASGNNVGSITIASYGVSGTTDLQGYPLVSTTTAFIGVKGTSAAAAGLIQAGTELTLSFNYRK